MSGASEGTLLADLSAERSLIGAALADGHLLARVQLAAADFFDPHHGKIWSAMVEIAKREEAVSVAVLGAALPDLDRYIAMLPDQVTGSPEQQALTIRDFAIRRKIVVVAERLHASAGDMSRPSFEIIADMIGEASKLQVGKPPMSNRAVMMEIIEDLDRDAPIYSTGLPDLDESMGGGLIAGKFYGFGARKKVGKTILLGSISFNLNHDGVPHLFVSLEMKPMEIEQRNVGRARNFNSSAFLHRPDWIRGAVQTWARETPNNVLYEHCPGATFGEMRGTQLLVVG